MLCPHCRRQVPRGALFCPSCSTPLNGATAVYEIVLRDTTRMSLLEGITIGRGPANTVQFDGETVSRHHARITPDANGGPPSLEDAGSSYGTWVDGRRVEGPLRLRDGSHIRVGDEEIVVERRRGPAEAGRTIVVPVGESLVMPAVGKTPALEPALDARHDRPRLRSGYALKRLVAAEGPRRWVLNDLNNGKFLH